MSWSPPQNPTLRFSDTKEHFIFILSISVCPLFQCVRLECRRALKLHSLFWCYGSCISVFGNFLVLFQINWKGNFESNCFDSVYQLNNQCNEMWCMKTTQFVQSILNLVLHFQQTILNITIYCYMHRITMCCDIIVCCSILKLKIIFQLSVQVTWWHSGVHSATSVKIDLLLRISAV